MVCSLHIDDILSATKFGDLIELSYPIGYSHLGVYDEDGHIIHFAVTGEAWMWKHSYKIGVLQSSYVDI